MIGTEKRTFEVKLRFSERVYFILLRLAEADDRTLADYLHHHIERLVFGLSYILDVCTVKPNRSDGGD